eukprot:141555_1
MLATSAGTSCSEQCLQSADGAIIQAINRRFIEATLCWKKANQNKNDNIPKWVTNPDEYIININDSRYSTLKQTKEDILKLCAKRRGPTEHKGKPLTTKQWRHLYSNQFERYYPKNWPTDMKFDPQNLLKVQF